MKKKVIFIIETSYQLFYSAIISYYMNKKGVKVYAIMAPYNYELVKIAGNIKWIEVLYIFHRYKFKNQKIQLIKEVLFTRKILNNVIKLNVQKMFIYKDSGFIQSRLIEALKEHNNCKTILIEEGLSLYADQKKLLNEYDFLKRFKQKTRVALMRLLGADGADFGFGYNKKLSYILCFDSIKMKEKNNIFPVLSLPCSLPNNKILENIKNAFYCGGPWFNDFRNKKFRFLYLGQPLSELNIISKEKEHEFLNSMSEIIEKHNINVLVKPHPVEDPRKYGALNNFSLINSAYLPIELIFSEFNIKLVVTPYSSAGRNLQNFYNIQTVYLYKILGIDVNPITNNDRAPACKSDFEASIKELCSIIEYENNCDILYDKLVTGLID